MREIALTNPELPGEGTAADTVDADAVDADHAVDVGDHGVPEAVEPAHPDAHAEVGDVYEARYGDMVRLAFLLTGSQEAAADITQDSFVKVFRKWDSVREPEAYVRRVVVNGCKSMHRRSRRERDRIDTSADLVVDLEADEISDALAALPHRQRAAIVLRYYDDCSEREIAEALGCRPGTVGSLLHRGLAQLREVIEQ